VALDAASGRETAAKSFAVPPVDPPVPAWTASQWWSGHVLLTTPEALQIVDTREGRLLSIPA
jgi:hypothetical protein